MHITYKCNSCYSVYVGTQLYRGLKCARSAKDLNQLKFYIQLGNDFESVLYVVRKKKESYTKTIIYHD